MINAGAAFELRAAVTAEASTYAGLVRLVREAGAQGAPVVRLADRYAAWFLRLSLMTAGLAWAISGSAVRAVAVLVVATPCPLLLGRLSGAVLLRDPLRVDAPRTLRRLRAAGLRRL